MIQAVYDLAAHPEWTDVLREEMEQVLTEERKEGSEVVWTRSMITKLKKLDSFFKESLRVNGLVDSESQPLRFRGFLSLSS
jgi:hypothetical protein